MCFVKICEVKVIADFESVKKFPPFSVFPSRFKNKSLEKGSTKVNRVKACFVKTRTVKPP
jgi:hypothetical protein